MFRTALLPFALLVVLLAAVATFAAPAAGQAVEGRVIDSESGDGVELAELVLRDARGSIAARTRSDDAGWFLLSASIEGSYRIEVERLGYLAPEPLALDLGRERVTVEILLGRAPLALEPLTVTGRRADPRHEASFEGARARHDLFPAIGSRRVVMRGDWELDAAGTVSGVLSLIGFPPRCTIVWWNGSMVNTELSSEMWLRHTSPEAMEAVEYYRRWSDAPAAYRTFPSWVDTPAGCGVVALWPRLEPLRSPYPVWRRALSVTLVGGAAWLAGRWFLNR
jgi:hypothetical protein